MTLLSVVQDVCATVGVLRPQSVFSNITGNRTMQEMVSLANEMAQRIAYDTRDWQTLTAVHTFVGDGVSSFFAMPANYKRLLLTANVRRVSTPATPMTFIPDVDQWYERRANKRSDTGNGEWIIANNAMSFYPILAKNMLAVWSNSCSYQTVGNAVYDDLDNTSWVVAVAHVSAPAGTTFAADRSANPSYWTSTPNVPDGAQFAYLDKNCVMLASGGLGDSFMNDLDQFRLDERLLKLGMIWQWKAQKGSAYAEDMGTYGDALTYAMGHDKPAPIIIGRSPISAHAKVAYPWPVPT